MANGIDPVTWGKLIREHGFSTILAIALLGAVLGWLPSPMLSAHMRLISQMNTHMRNESTRTYLLRIICQDLVLAPERKVKCLDEPPEREGDH